MKNDSEGILVLSGVDARFIDASLSLVKKRYPRKTYYLKTEVGGVKPLLNWDPKNRSCCIGGLESVRNTHNIRTVVLISHEDSAAYGGSRAFIDKRAEENFHVSQLSRAKSVLKQSAFANLDVRTYYAYIKGKRVAFKNVEAN